MAESRALIHEIPGQHKIDDVLYTSATSAAHLDKLRKMDFKAGDILLATYPKSGTTWMQEILYLIHNGVDPDEAKKRSPMVRIPFIEMDALWNIIRPRKAPRLLKTHLQSQYFRRQIEANQVKVIFVTRNPKDTLASYYHFYKKMEDLGNFSGSWSEFFEIIQANQLVYGDWFDFTLSWWGLKDRDNVLVLKYEDMKKDPLAMVKKVSEFCGVSLTEDKIQKVVDVTSFDSMKKDPANEFKLRKGATGDWKTHFTINQAACFDSLAKERLQESCLSFDYE